MGNSNFEESSKTPRNTRLWHKRIDGILIVTMGFQHTTHEMGFQHTTHEGCVYFKQHREHILVLLVLQQVPPSLEEPTPRSSASA
jgi:hypothetical protein